MKADRSRNGDYPRDADPTAPPNRPDEATGDAGAPAPVLTFSPRRSYRRHGGRWLIDAEDAVDGDEHRRASAGE